VAHLATQRPLAQMALPPQTVLHAPQWKRSFWRSTQPVPQTSRPAVQPITQAPFWQRAPGAQALPQPPQFAASLCGSVQVPLQLASGALQLQLPPMHSSRASQVVPQPPQLRRSALMSMQRPLQNDWPAGQL
jgi:hypothetical protein